MLRWCIYIRSINPEVRHISRNRNAVADILSRARYKEEEILDLDDEDKEQTVLTSSIIREGGMQFLEEEYEEEFTKIGKYLQTPDKYKGRSGKEFTQFRKKSHKFFLHEGYLWRHPKTKTGNQQRVIGSEGQRKEIMRELHDKEWVGHLEYGPLLVKLKKGFGGLDTAKN